MAARDATIAKLQAEIAKIDQRVKARAYIVEVLRQLAKERSTEYVFVEETLKIERILLQQIAELNRKKQELSRKLAELK